MPDRRPRRLLACPPPIPCASSPLPSLPPERPLDPRLATAGGLFALLVWGFTLAWVRGLTAELGSIGAGAWMCLVATATVWAARVAREGLTAPRVSTRTVTLNGTLFALYLVLFTTAVGRAQTAQESVTLGLVNYLWPSLSILLGRHLAGRRITPTLLAGIALALAGTAVAVLGRADVSVSQTVAAVVARPLPYAAALGAALCWTVYSNTAAWGVRDGDENPVVVYLPLATAGTVALAMLTDGLGVPQSPGSWISALTLGVATGIAYLGWDAGARHGDRALLGTASLFVPILSVTTAAIAFGSMPPSNVWVGAGMLVAAAALSNRR